MHKICHKNSIFGLYLEYRYRKNAQMAHTGRNGGSELWQGTVIMENGDLYGKCRLLDVCSMERTGAPLPTAGSGVPGASVPTDIAKRWRLVMRCLNKSFALKLDRCLGSSAAETLVKLQSSAIISIPNIASSAGKFPHCLVNSLWLWIISELMP